MRPTRTSLTPENNNEVDSLGYDPGDTGAIEMGTVGWDDGSDYVDQGGSGNDGKTLVKVQLFRGRDPATPLKPNVAQGFKLWAQVSGLGGFNVIPPQGAQVLVAIPAGARETPGAALIIGVYPQSPTVQFAPDRWVLDAGPNTHVVLRGKSVTLEDWNSTPRAISVGIPRAGGAAGVYLYDETGSGITSQAGTIGLFSAYQGDVKAVIQIQSGATGGEFDIVVKTLTGASSGCKWFGGDSHLFGNNWFNSHATSYFGNITNNPSPPYSSPPFPLYVDNNGSPTPSTIIYTQG